jgi:hypothetical protein
MAEMLGIGLTHSPSLIAPDEDGNTSLARALRNNDNIPAKFKDPSSWPEAIRLEWSDDHGLASAKAQRERLVNAFRRLRSEIDAFNPDFLLIWGDDQYENFKEDIIPPFCVLAYEDMECQPFTNKDGSARRNIWDEPADKVFKYRGHQSGARSLVSDLINQGFDLAYAYKPLHESGGLGNTPSSILCYTWTTTGPVWIIPWFHSK